MSEMKDPSFRLFGRNIQLGANDVHVVSIVGQLGRDYNHDYEDNSCDYECISSSDNSKHDENKAQYENTNQEWESDSPKSKNQSNSTITEDPKTVSDHKDDSSLSSHTKESSDQTSSAKPTDPQDQSTLKKPETIIPCPRCNSMSTKFCYFNNYNVHQPRHFCKDCQRYWTAGGTMRNVPVGSGKRKRQNVPDAYASKGVVYQPYGFVQENMNVENGLNFQGFSQVPYTWNPMGRISFYPTIPENCGVVRHKGSKFDDPIEARNSSIWTTLKTKNNHDCNIRPVTKTGFFGGVQRYNGNGNHERSNNLISRQALPMVLEFNPAACSRSLSFQEIAR